MYDMYGIFTIILPTWLGDFVRANVGKYSSTMVRIWGIAAWWFQTWLDYSVWEWSSQVIFLLWDVIIPIDYPLVNLT